jgi:hypothetical protein
MEYGAVDRGEGLRTSCSIFWRVRQSAGVRDGRGESLRVDGELILSSRRDCGLIFSLSWVRNFASCEMGCSGVDCMDVVADDGVCGGVSSSSGGAIVDRKF